MQHIVLWFVKTLASLMSSIVMSLFYNYTKQCDDENGIDKV